MNLALNLVFLIAQDKQLHSEKLVVSRLASLGNHRFLLPCCLIDLVVLAGQILRYKIRLLGQRLRSSAFLVDLMASI